MQPTSISCLKSSTSSKYPNQLSCVFSRHFKKVTDLKRASFASIDGLLIADKTGEIGFINLKNLEKLPKLEHLPEEVEEETKEAKGISLPAFEEDGVYKTMYGHQESCLGL